MSGSNGGSKQPGRKSSSIWNAEKEMELADMWNKGVPSYNIRIHFGVSHAAIQGKISRLRRHGVALLSMLDRYKVIKETGGTISHYKDDDLKRKMTKVRVFRVGKNGPPDFFTHPKLVSGEGVRDPKKFLRDEGGLAGNRFGLFGGDFSGK